MWGRVKPNSYTIICCVVYHAEQCSSRVCIHGDISYIYTIQVYSIVHEYYYVHFSNLVIGGLDRRVIIIKYSRDCGSPGSHVHACG